MIEVNYLAILVCGILSMVVGSVWYGPLFGKKWMEIIGVDPNSMSDEKKKEMQKKAMPLYLVQAILTFFQVYVLAYYIAGWTEASGIENALWIWGAFIVPTLAGASMWTNDSRKIAWSRFLIQSGYQLVIFIIFGLILKA